MTIPVPPEVIIKVARTQGGIPAHRAVCAACRTSRATDPHHWLFKRSSGVSRRSSDVPEEVLHHPNNIVLLCRDCHDSGGQTTCMAKICFRYKESIGVDVFNWVESLIEEGLIKTRPNILWGIAND